MMRYFILYLFFMFSFTTSLTSQSIRLTGNLSAVGESYRASSQAPSLAYRAPWNHRIVARAVLHLGNLLEIPLTLYLSKQGLAYQSTSLGRYPSVPAVYRFNQLGLTPRIGSWLQLYLGSFSKRLSEFSFGNIRMEGFGVELTPAGFRLGFFTGLTRREQSTDFLSGIPGSYRRQVWAAQAGIDRKSLRLLLTVVHQKDDTTRGRVEKRLFLPDSIHTVPAPATENTVASLVLGFRVSQIGQFRSEVAVSAFSRDISIPEIETNIPDWLFVPRYSSQVDGAVKASLTLSPSRTFTLNLDGRWIGPGFITLGYPQLENDLVQLTVAPQFRLLQQRLMIRLHGGFRQNNLRNNRISTSKRTIGGALVSWQLSPQFSLQADYQNYGIRIQHLADSLRLENVNHQINLRPQFRWQWGSASQSLSLNLSYQTSVERTVVHHGLDNTSRSFSLIHFLQFLSRLSISSSFTHMLSRGPDLNVRTWVISETIRYPFSNRFQIRFSVNYSQLTVLESSSYFRTGGELTYRLPPQIGGTIALKQDWRKQLTGSTTFSELFTVLRYEVRW